MPVPAIQKKNNIQITSLGKTQQQFVQRTFLIQPPTLRIWFLWGPIPKLLTLQNKNTSQRVSHETKDRSYWLFNRDPYIQWFIIFMFHPHTTGSHFIPYISLNNQDLFHCSPEFSGAPKLPATWRQPSPFLLLNARVDWDIQPLLAANDPPMAAAKSIRKGMAIHFGGVKVITFRLEKETFSWPKFEHPKIRCMWWWGYDLDISKHKQDDNIYNIDFHFNLYLCVYNCIYIYIYRIQKCMQWIISIYMYVDFAFCIPLPF